MRKGRIRLIGAIPGPANLAPIVREFSRRPGLVTSLSDPAVKTLAALIPEGADVESVPFGSLVRRLAAMCGELPMPIAHEGHAMAAVGAACEELAGDGPFALTANRPGLHRAITEALRELSDGEVGPEELDVAAAQAEPGLSSKLASLSEIERQAAETLRQLGRSFSREHYGLCLGGALEMGADLGRVLVLAGSRFVPKAIKLLQWAARQGADVTIVTYRHPAGADIFKGALRTHAALGIEPEPAGTSNRLLLNLFVDERPADSHESDSELQTPNAKLVSAADPLAEAEWALRGCIERHREGTPYERMALYVRDLTAYAPLIEASAKRLGVPLRMWRRAPLMTNSFARLAQAALEFCASRDVRTLMPIARTTYVALDHEARESLGSALRAAHSTRTEQWRSLREWSAAQDDRFAWLGKLLDWRDDAIAAPALPEAWIGKLRDLMILLPIENGPAAGRERDRRAGYVLHQSLNQLASVRRLRKPRSITLGEFARSARATWAESDVSVPAGDIGLFVTAQADSLPASSCLFVLGMLEGVFPRRRTEDPVLSDFDREAISAILGGEPLPTSRDRAEAERDEFYSVCAAATDSLILSYPETDEDRDNVPAFYLDEVERALGHVEKLSRSRRDLTPALEDCLADSDRRIKAAMEVPDRAEPLPLEFTNPFTSRAFAPDGKGLKPRELREALQCPFSYFARRKLRVQPQRLRARWFSLVRLPEDAGLALGKDDETARRALESALERHLDELVSDAPDWEIALLRSGGRRQIREWIDREFAARRLWPKAEVKTGVAFGEEGLRDSLPKKVKLGGSVPATSRLGPYSVVHLVETSGPAKSYGTTNELADQDKLYYGVHLLAAWPKESAAAVEVETMAGERFLLVLPRVAGVNLAGRADQGLRVIDLAGSESIGTREFFDGVKELAGEAARRVESVDVRAIKGEHCAWCDYGELCRQSFDFGEDTPFVDDF
ncbi:MAG TPA: hypothetical protein VMI31_17060 [Fimbriimonadaceae bacterium]|nr:hypothetical protein [Fimbriimonadaceae bacterium]